MSAASPVIPPSSRGFDSRDACGKLALVRVLHLGLVLILAGCPSTPPSAETAPRSDAPPAAADPQPTAEAAAPSLPPSTKTFAVSLEPGEPEVVLGTWEDTLWAHRPRSDGSFDELWVSKGPGAVQEVVAGELGGERSLFVGRGRARGNLIPFVRVDRVDPATGTVSPLLREESDRADVAQLVLADLDGSGPTLVVGYFESKHSVGVRNLRSDGTVQRAPSQLMATSRVFADLDGDGTPDEVIGRVYSDDQGSPGDLSVRIGERSFQIPTDRGVRSVAVVQLEGDERPTIYFADGWSSNYGAEGRAKLARARFDGEGFQVERLAESPGEYTLFSILVTQVGGAERLFVQGSRYLSVLAPDPQGGLTLRRLLAFDNGAGQGALGRGHDGSVWWYWPGEGRTTATRVELDVLKPLPVARGG